MQNTDASASCTRQRLSETMSEKHNLQHGIRPLLLSNIQRYTLLMLLI